MSEQTTGVAGELLGYLQGIQPPEPDILRELRNLTQQQLPKAMQVAYEQVHMLTWLARLLRVERYLEIGVFTGYSSTAMALALPDSARITACDINVTFTRIAQEFWQRANVAHKITLHLQPALITLDELLENGQENHFDFALIDADKAPTAAYVERCHRLVHLGGVIAIDNVLLGGRVFRADAARSASVTALQQFNATLPHDTRFEPLTLPLGDGLTLLRKIRN